MCCRNNTYYPRDLRYGTLFRQLLVAEVLYRSYLFGSIPEVGLSQPIFQMAGRRSPPIAKHRTRRAARVG
jgi:hypothetical protein